MLISDNSATNNGGGEDAGNQEIQASSETDSNATDGNAQVEEKNWTFDELEQEGVFNGEEFNQTYKGLDHPSAIINVAPEPVKKMFSNLRADYTRKTQEIAQLRQSLEAERAALQRDRELLSNPQWQESLRASAEKVVEDPWSQEGIEAMIEKKAAQKLQEVFKPFQEQHEASLRQAQFDAFKASNPDINDLSIKKEVATVLRSNPGVDLESAYWIVKGKQAAQAREVNKSNASATMNVLKKSSSGAPVPAVDVPKFKSAVEAMEYWQAQGADAQRKYLEKR